MDTKSLLTAAWLAWATLSTVSGGSVNVDWPEDLPHSGNSDDKKLLSANSRALKSMPRQVDTFLENVNWNGLMNVDRHLQIIQPVKCFTEGLSTCYLLRGNSEALLKNLDEFSVIVVRVSSAYRGHTLGLFALQDRLDAEFLDMLLPTTLKHRVYQEGNLLTWSNFTMNETEFVTFSLSECTSTLRRAPNSLQRWYSKLKSSLKSNKYSGSYRRLTGFTVRCLTCPVGEGKANHKHGGGSSGGGGLSASPLGGNNAEKFQHKTAEMIYMTDSCVRANHRLRLRRSVGARSNGGDICTGDRRSCCVRPYDVDQGQATGDGIFFKPQIVTMNLCQGHCADPSTAHSNRMNFINGIHSFVPQEVKDALLTQRCCAPQKWKPFTIMYYDSQQMLKVKELSNFTVVQCGCT